MTTLKFAIAALILTTPPAFAQGKSKYLLPLERGAYEETTTPCEQRSNATARTFFGDRLNSARTECKITNVKQSGQVYSFIASCLDDGSTERYDESYVVTINNKKSFTLKTEYGATEYRWCAYTMFE